MNLDLNRRIGIALIEGQSALADDLRTKRLRGSLDLEAEIWWDCLMRQNGQIDEYTGGSLQAPAEGVLRPPPDKRLWAKDVLTAIQTRAHFGGSWTVGWLFPWDEFMFIYKDFNGDIVEKGSDVAGFHAMNAAEELVRNLGGRHGMARCPCHRDREPSLAVKYHDGRLLWHCHAGCSQEDVGHELSRRGLLDSTCTWSASRRSSSNNHSRGAGDIARKLVRQAVDPTRTATARYLAYRGITLGFDGRDLGHIDRLRHPTGSTHPAMVATIRNAAGEITGCQRTFLDVGGFGKATVAEFGPKLSLGDCKGAAIRLTPIAETLWVAEGVENALSIVQMLGQSCWALPGAKFFQHIDLPSSVRRVVLAADDDPAGNNGIHQAINKLRRQGIHVAVAVPNIVGDWNDALFQFEERMAIATIDGGELEDVARRMAVEEISP